MTSMAASATIIEKKSPFSEYASETVLTKLKEYEASVDESYRKSLPKEAELDANVSLKIPNVDWDQVAIDGVLGEGGFSFIFRVS